MSDQMLPIEYQSQIDALKKRQMMAQLLQKQGLNPAIAQSQGRMAARTSPLSFLSSALSSYIGTQADAKADQGISGVKQKYVADAQGAVDAFLKTPEEEQDAFAAKSPFPVIQQMAKTLAERKKQRVSDFITAVKDVDPAAAGGAALAGNVPRTPYSVPGLKPSETGNLPDGTAYVRDFNRKNEPTTRLVGKGVSVVNQIPKAENRLGLDVLEAGLKPREEAATAAKNVIASTNRAMDSLVRGAQAGGGQTLKQALRKTAQAFGITPPETAETDELRMALGSAILAEAAKLKPISNTDIDFLKEIVGNINTDPNALTRALAFMQAEAIRGLQGFGKYVEEQSSTVQDPTARQRLAGVTIGNELPNQLFGPSAFQMAVMQQLQQAGGDISKFQNTSVGRGDAKSGSKTPMTGAFEPGATFDIRNPAAALPVGQPKGAPQVLTVDQLSEAQRAQLLQILQGGK